MENLSNEEKLFKNSNLCYNDAVANVSQSALFYTRNNINNN